MRNLHVLHLLVMVLLLQVLDLLLPLRGSSGDAHYSTITFADAVEPTLVNVQFFPYNLRGIAAGSGPNDTTFATYDSPPHILQHDSNGAIMRVLPFRHTPESVSEIAVTSSGVIFLTDSVFYSVLSISPDGLLIANRSMTDFPMRILVDKNDTLYASSCIDGHVSECLIDVFPPTSHPTYRWSVVFPDFAVDTQGSLFVVDENFEVRKLLANGEEDRSLYDRRINSSCSGVNVDLNDVLYVQPRLRPIWMTYSASNGSFLGNFSLPMDDVSGCIRLTFSRSGVIARRTRFARKFSLDGTVQFFSPPTYPPFPTSLAIDRDGMLSMLMSRCASTALNMTRVQSSPAARSYGCIPTSGSTYSLSTIFVFDSTDRAIVLNREASELGISNSTTLPLAPFAVTRSQASITINSNLTDVFVTDPANNRILRVPLSGATPTIFATGISNVTGIDFSVDGFWYAAGGSRLTQLSANGSIVSSRTISGMVGTRSLSVDNAGNVYIGDTLGQQILLVTPAGGVSVFASQVPPQYGRTNVVPTAVVVTKDGGCLYVIDNHELPYSYNGTEPPSMQDDPRLLVYGTEARCGPRALLPSLPTTPLLPRNDTLNLSASLGCVSSTPSAVPGAISFTLNIRVNVSAAQLAFGTAFATVFLSALSSDAGVPTLALLCASIQLVTTRVAAIVAAGVLANATTNDASTSLVAVTFDIVPANNSAPSTSASLVQRLLSNSSVSSSNATSLGQLAVGLGATAILASVSEQPPATSQIREHCADGSVVPVGTCVPQGSTGTSNGTQVSTGVSTGTSNGTQVSTGVSTGTSDGSTVLSDSTSVSTGAIVAIVVGVGGGVALLVLIVILLHRCRQSRRKALTTSPMSTPQRLVVTELASSGRSGSARNV